MNTPHILVVEDEESLAAAIRINLQLEKYTVTVVRSGSEASRMFHGDPSAYTLVLLDVMLPDINGFELCKAFKSKVPELPVIFLTAKNQTRDKLEGLRLGADDYITKPFELEELLLRISNLIKRTQRDKAESFTFKNGYINFETFEITDLLGQRHTLSKREIGLLELLTSNANKVISRDQILEKLWDADENASARTIDNYILNFRKYFENNPKDPRYFHSVRGVGYKFTND